MTPTIPLSGEYLRTSLDRVPDGVLIERDGTIVYVNEAYQRMLGYDERELLGRETTAIVAAEDEQRLRRFASMRSRSEPAPSRYRFHARRRDGSTLLLDASVCAVRLGAQTFITTIVRGVEADERGDDRGLRVLSTREREVALRTIRGERPKEIALALGLSDRTVATHRARIFRKLALRHDLDLFRFAAERGLLSA